MDGNNYENLNAQAIGAASSFSDRLCIATKGKFNELMSVQDLMTCCTSCGGPKGGCDGGIPIEAWKYLIRSGVVTGGSYNTSDVCE